MVSKVRGQNRAFFTQGRIGRIAPQHTMIEPLTLATPFNTLRDQPGLLRWMSPNSFFGPQAFL
jgi:hypothetical protein